jgi:hypothetical protein
MFLHKKGCMMQGSGNQSEVSRLIHQIDAEYTAARLAMAGYAEVARHEAITKRMENMGRLHEELMGIVGEEKATEALVRAMSGEA